MVVFHPEPDTTDTPPPPAWLQDIATLANSTTQVDVSGGWLISGSPLKPLMPAAYTTTTLAWALLAFPAGFTGASRREALANVRTGADYLLRSWDATAQQLVVQVGGCMSPAAPC